MLSCAFLFLAVEIAAPSAPARSLFHILFACLRCAAKDVPGGNDIGPVIKDEELFATVGWVAVGQICMMPFTSSVFLLTFDPVLLLRCNVAL